MTPSPLTWPSSAPPAQPTVVVCRTWTIPMTLPVISPAFAIAPAECYSKTTRWSCPSSTTPTTPFTVSPWPRVENIAGYTVRPMPYGPTTLPCCPFRPIPTTPRRWKTIAAALPTTTPTISPRLPTPPPTAALPETLTSPPTPIAAALTPVTWPKAMTPTAT